MIRACCTTLGCEKAVKIDGGGMRTERQKYIEDVSTEFSAALELWRSRYSYLNVRIRSCYHFSNYHKRCHDGFVYDLLIDM